MSILPTEPIYSKLLINTLKTEYICIKNEIVSIVSMLSVENIFYFDSRSNDKKDKFIIKNRKKLMNTQSDHLTLLNIMNNFEDILKTNGKQSAR